MRVLVTGGRDYKDRGRAFAILNTLTQKVGVLDALIVGDARGADQFAREWARDPSTPFDKDNLIVEYAEWAKYGRAAGPLRNTVLLKHNPDLVIAYPGGS